jgi:DNA-binding protein HU-beta
VQLAVPRLGAAQMAPIRSRRYSARPAGILPAAQGDDFMNHAELSDSVATALGLSKADAKKAVDAVFAAITDAAAKGDEVSVNGFGKFKVKESAAREGRNPSTGETIQIAASKKLTFGAAKAVKDRLNG